MRPITAIAAAMVAVSAAAAHESEESPFTPGLRIVEKRGIVRPGGTVRARVLWELGDSGAAAGRFDVRWQLRAADGTILNHGRRPFRIPPSAHPPHRFTVHAKVPRDAGEWQGATLEVGIEGIEDGDPLESAHTQVWIQPNRLVPLRYLPPVAVEGRLAGSGWFGVLAVVPEGEDDRPWTLVGPALAEALRHPDGEGAFVRVEGREAAQSGVLHIPESAPRFVQSDDLVFLDVPPEQLGASSPVRGDAEESGAPLPCPWGRGSAILFTFESPSECWEGVACSRTPRVAETPEELSVLRTEFGDALGGLPPVDFEASRIVVVTAGLSPEGVSASVASAWYEPRHSRTTVLYDVVGDASAPERGYLPGPDLRRPFEAVVLPRRPGSVVFRRREWVAPPPAWWPPTPAY